MAHDAANVCALWLLFESSRNSYFKWVLSGIKCKIFRSFAEYSWTVEKRAICKLNKRMAPQVGLESTFKRSFNNMQVSG
jgi:hypothetical protein